LPGDVHPLFGIPFLALLLATFKKYLTVALCTLRRSKICALINVGGLDGTLAATGTQALRGAHKSGAGAAG
jgi:hypothetical protein